MRVTPRAAIAILAVGLSVEALVSLYLNWGRAWALPLSGVILAIGPILTVAGLLALWVGRSELKGTSGDTFHSADAAFGFSILALLVAGGFVGWYVYQGSSVVSTPALVGFGIAASASIFLTFATFALIAYPLTREWGRALIGVGLAWALFISTWIGFVLARELPQVVQTIESGSMSVLPLVSPVTAVEVFLWPTYLLFLVAYLDVIHRLGAGNWPAPRASDSPHAA
jgi:hypothetical protein